MDRNEFDNLELLDQINYINDILKENTLTKICLIIGIGRSTLRDRFIKGGYVFNTISRQYDKDNTLVIQTYHPSRNVSQRVITGGSNTLELQKYDDILELLEYKEDILEMLKHYKGNVNIIEVPQLDINTFPIDLQTDIVAKTMKFYKPIDKLFDGLCSNYSSVKKQDLISLALYEFCNRYRK